MKTILFAVLSLGFALSSAHAEVKSVQITSTGEMTKYSAVVYAWMDDQGPTEIKMTGSASLSLINEKKEFLEESLAGNRDYQRHLLNFGGRNYEVIYAFGDDLKAMGGIDGIVTFFKNLGLELKKPKKVAKDFDTVFVLINRDGEAVMDTALSKSEF